MCHHGGKSSYAGETRNEAVNANAITWNFELQFSNH